MNSTTSIINNKKIIITAGEPAGIGPDIIIMMAQKKWNVPLVICADSYLLLDRAKQLKLPLKLHTYDSKKELKPCPPGEINILNISVFKKVIPGQLNNENNNYVLSTLTKAAQECVNKQFSALVTGPINKAIINTQGIAFSGHTEFLSQYSNNVYKKTVMMLANKKLRIALTTTHIPIVSISKLITKKLICDTISILAEGLQNYFNILYPKIYVCGLNPHAGESGYIGQEEIKIIIPALYALRKQVNYDIIGPLPADTIFQPKYLNQADVILTMYHDQGLPVLKYASFGKSVNITFGLPFIRTSVDHGTALELSGTGRAKSDSMEMAILVAIEMINNFYTQKHVL